MFKSFLTIELLDNASHTETICDKVVDKFVQAWMVAIYRCKTRTTLSHNHIGCRQACHKVVKSCHDHMQRL